MTGGWLYYTTERLAVVPYCPQTPVYYDGMLPHIYSALKAEDKIADMFCGESKNMDAWIAYFDRIKTAQILCRITETKDLVPVGISWVDLPKGSDGARQCQCGMAFFGDASRTEDARSLARLALAYGFEELRVDVFFGVQLASNLAARNFSLKMGFREVAMVPNWHPVDGELLPARVMMLEKEKFMPAFNVWKANQKSVEIPA